MMAGLLLGGLAGAAAGFSSGFDEDVKERRAERMDLRRAEIEDQRARALILFKQGVENQARTDMAARVNTAAGGIADRAVGQKRGLIEGNIVDRENWTPEQQAAVDQSLGLDRAALAEDPDVRTAAAVQTGDIDPKTAAGLDLQGKKAEAQAKAAERKEALELEKLNRRDTNARLDRELREKNAEQRFNLMMARIGASGRDKDNSTKELLSFLEGSRKELATDESNLRLQYKEERAALGDFPKPEAKAKLEQEYGARFEDIKKKRRQLEADFNYARDKAGLPAVRADDDAPAARSAPAPAPAKASAPISSLPEGARQIGTSGGKPVYQTPDGRKFIAQ